MSDILQYEHHLETLKLLKDVVSILGKINDRLDLIANPVFIYNQDTKDLRPLNQAPGSVFPLCKCGGLIEEKRDDSNL